MKITFPNKTAKEIVDERNNTLNGHKLLWNTDWYANEDFYTKEKCRKGTREIITCSRVSKEGCCVTGMRGRCFLIPHWPPASFQVQASRRLRKNGGCRAVLRIP